VCVCVCVSVTSEEHALAEVTAHVIHADGLDSKQVQHIRGDGRNDGLLDNNTHTHTHTHTHTQTKSVRFTPAETALF